MMAVGSDVAKQNQSVLLPSGFLTLERRLGNYLVQDRPLANALVYMAPLRRLRTPS